MKYLEELKREELPLEGQMILPEVETLDFIKEGRSIVMFGNPGTGKTHTAIGLGIKACLEGYSVFFTSVPHLLTMIREAKTEKTLRNLEIKFERYDLAYVMNSDMSASTRKVRRCFSITSHSEPERNLRLSRRTCPLQGGKRC